MSSISRKTIAILIAAASFTAVTPAFAEDEGPYAVGRIGATFKNDLRPGDRLPTVLKDDVKFEKGLMGEIGGGYDFGFVRVEGTLGYSQVKLGNEKNSIGFDPESRLKNFNLGLSAYVDMPVSETVQPYIGGGIAASRVDGRLGRTFGTPQTVARFADKDWGLQWHADAGVGVKAAERTTIDLGIRYTRTDKLDLKGGVGTTAAFFSPRVSNVSVLLGIRQGF